MKNEPLRGVRVLIVDDDDDTRDLYQLVLVQAGADVQPAADGREAVRAAIQSPPMVIVSDLTLPGTDGCTLLRELRTMAHLRDVPAVAVSGRAEDPHRADALAAGFQECIAKPVDPGKLVALVKRWAAMVRAAPPT